MTRSGLSLVATMLLVMWGVQLANVLTGYAFLSFGLYPRSSFGLVGIGTMPFLHGSWTHIISNTVPFFILSLLILTNGVSRWVTVTVAVMILCGSGVWVFARPALHVGASGLVFGYFGYLVAYGWFRRNFRAILIALMTGVAYGGMIWGVLPLRAGVSFEAHLFGFVAGVLVAAYFGRRKR